MDTLTHAISGALLARVACVRPAAPPMPHEVALVLSPQGRYAAAWDHAPGHLMPWQAMLVGALAAAFPDSDALAQLGGDFYYLRHHRGITHSVLLAPLWALLLAWLCAQAFAITRQRPGGWKALYAPALGGILLHIAGDWITPFGTMMLAPLSDRRFGLGAMFIIDLAFSAILVAAWVVAAFFPRRRWPPLLGLVGAAAWVVLAWTGKREAEAAALAHAQAQGITVQQVAAMPRPASPFNWTVAVYDGRDYHLAHLNTRREQALVAQPGDNFIRRFSAPYQPLAQATWARVPRFGEDPPAWVQEAWGHEAFATYRWFAEVPVLLETKVRDYEGGTAAMSERCAAFRDLRFEFPGRETSPFRFAVCLGDAGSARVLRVEAAGWRPL